MTTDDAVAADDAGASAPPALTLTPERLDEVRRNLLLWAGGAVGAVVVFALVLMFLINPADPTGPAMLGLGVGLVAAFSSFLVVYAGAALAVAFIADGWPAFLRRRRLERDFGLERGTLSNRALRPRFGSRAHWRGSAAGLAIGLAFAGLWLLSESSRRRSSAGDLPFGPALMLFGFCGGMAGRATSIRALIAETARAEGRPSGDDAA